MIPLYTVSRCRGNDDLYGPSHGSDIAEETLCGVKLDDYWYVTNNTFDGTVTCKKCLQIMVGGETRSRVGRGPRTGLKRGGLSRGEVTSPRQSLPETSRSVSSGHPTKASSLETD
jgi:hypothetical protein